MYGKILEMLVENQKDGSTFWTDGDIIFCKDEAKANALADLLDDCGYDAVTGYYDPDEDEKSGMVDRCTGYYYVDV